MTKCLKRLILMLASTFLNYRLDIAEITENKQKYLIFIVIPQGRKSFI